jgi:predicted dehydrogenase
MTAPIFQFEAMKRKILSLGFVGGGWNSAVGETHFIAARMDGLFTIDAGVFSRHADVNRQTGERWSITPERIYDTIDDMLEGESGRLDAIAVLTPTPDHVQTVIKALEKGFRVICEKALATTADEARQIARVAAATGGFVAVTFNYSGYPMIRELRRMIGDGKLGEVTQVHVEMPQEGFVRLGPDERPASPQAWRAHDGPVPTISLDLGDHLYHLVRFLTGQRPLEVLAMHGSHGVIEGVVDNVMCLARYSGGIDCSYWFGKSALGHRNGLRVRIYGRAGSAEWRQTEPEELLFCDAHGQRTVLDRASDNAVVASEPRYRRFKAGHPAGFIEAFANLYDDIGGCLEAHLEDRPWKSEFVVDELDALEGLATLEAMALSARGGWTKAPAKSGLALAAQ